MKANELGFQEMVAILSPLGLYGGNGKSKMPLNGIFGSLQIFPSDGCPTTAPFLASTQAVRSRRVSSASKISDCVIAHRSDWGSSPVRTVRPTGQTSLELLHLRLRFFGIGFVDQPRNPVVFY
jgi:hypothetical protein